MEPEGWTRARLGDVFGEVSDRNNRERLPVLAVTIDRGVVRRDSLDRKMDREVEQDAYLRAMPGDIAYNTMRMWQGGSGLVREPGFVSPAYTVVRPRPTECPEFWAHAFKSSEVIKAFRAFSQGVAKDRHRLYYDQFAAVQTMRPPLPEQRKIAAILSSVDETIEKTEAVIAQLEVVKKAMLEELLTRGIPGRHSRFKMTEIGEVPSDWSVVALDECNDPRRPICYGILMPGKHCAGGVPVIKVKNIKNGEVDASDLLLTAPEIDAQFRRSRLRGGDLLLTIRGTTGRVALVSDSLDGANITQDTARVSAGEGTSSAFLYYALQSANAQAQIREHTRGQAVKGINIGDVRRLLLPLPPSGEQQKIVETVRAIDEGFRAESLALDALRATKSALASVLLAGELRVGAGDAA